MLSHKPFNQSYRLYFGFLAALLFYIYEFALRNIFSAAPQAMIQHFHTNAFGLGIIASLFFYGYIPMQMPAGLLFDHYKLKTLFIYANLGCALAIGLFASSQNIIFACLSQFIFGLASSFAYVGCLIIAKMLWHEKYFAMMVGLIQLMGSCGAMLGGGPTAYSINKLGLPKTLLFFLIASVISLLLFKFSMQNQAVNQRLTRSLSYKANLKVVFTNAQTRWNALFAFFCWGPIATFGAVWGGAFLSTAYKMNNIKAASTLSVLWLGVAFGGPVLGGWSNFIKSRRLPMMICSILGFATIVCLLYLPNLTQPLIITLLILLGFSASVGSVSFGLVQDLHPKHSTATALSFNNMAIVGGGIILQPIIGWLLSSFNQHQPTMQNTTIYSLTSFHQVFIILPLCFLSSFLISFLFLKETHCNPKKIPATNSRA